MNKILRILMFSMFVSAIVAQAGPSLSVTLDKTTPSDGSTPINQTIYTQAKVQSYTNDHLAEQLAAGGYVEYKYNFEYDTEQGGVVSNPSPNPTAFITSDTCNTSGYFSGPAGEGWIRVTVTAHTCDRDGNEIPGSLVSSAASTTVIVWEIAITDVYGIGSTDKFIPLSSDSTKNKVTIKYKILPKDFQLNSVKIQVFKSDETTRVYEETYTDATYTKYTGTDLTITWTGTDNQTSNDYADPDDNTHKIKLIGAKGDDVCETDPEDINVVPLIAKVFPTHTPFSASAVAPQTLTITTVIKAQVDNTAVETNNYRYYTESGNSLSIWDGNHYYDNNSSANYSGSPLSYWIEMLNQVSLDPDYWNESNLGSLEYCWSIIRAPGDKNISDSNNDGVINDTFSNPGTYVYRVTVKNMVGLTTLQEKVSPSEKNTSSPETVIYTENIDDVYTIHLKEDNTSDAYSWATSFLKTPYWQRSAPKDYHGIDCSGLVHASNQLKGGWDTITNTEANTYLTSSSYSRDLSGDETPQRGDWMGVDSKADGDNIYEHIVIIQYYNNIDDFGFIHATTYGSPDEVKFGIDDNYPSANWNRKFRRPNH